MPTVGMLILVKPSTASVTSRPIDQIMLAIVRRKDDRHHIGQVLLRA